MKNSLIITQGLPNSGKSTFAKEQVRKLHKTTVRVNRDDLRQMLFNDICLDSRESSVTIAQEAQVIAFLKAGKNVIVDDTCLNEKVVLRWSEIAVDCDAEFEIKSFLDVPIEVCIERDSKRKVGRVGRAVIEGAALRYGMIDFSSHSKWSIWDFDGTISDASWRQHYVSNGNRDWNKFFEGVGEDPIRNEVVDVLREDSKNGIGIIILSGRPSDKCGIESDEWLKRNNVPHDHFFMRKAKDTRSDVIIKDEIFSLIPKEKVIRIVDDRRVMISYWKEQVKNTNIELWDVGNGEIY